MKNLIFAIFCLCLLSTTMEAQTFMDRLAKTKEEKAKVQPAQPATNNQYGKVSSQPKNNQYGRLPAANSNGNFVNLRNRWKGTFIHTEYGLEAGQLAKPDWHSAQWELEPVVQDRKYVRIKNRWKGTYLHVENGSLQASALGEPGWRSAQWEIEYVSGSFFRIKNRWKGTYIHNQYGTLTCGALGDSGWHSAMWESKSPGTGSSTRSTTASYPNATPMYFRYTDQVQGGGGLDLKVGSQIRVLPNQTVKSSPGISFDPNNPKICGKVFTVASLAPMRFTEPFPENMRNTNNSSFTFKVVKIK